MISDVRADEATAAGDYDGAAVGEGVVFNFLVGIGYFNFNLNVVLD